MKGENIDIKAGDQGTIGIIDGQVFLSFGCEIQEVYFSPKQAKHFANEILRMAKKVEVKKITEGVERRQEERGKDSTE